MWYNDLVDKSFFEDAAKVKKKKKISFITSSINLPIGNYGKRINLLNEILYSDLPIDIYGRGLNIKDSRYKGFIENKFQGLLGYDYSIAIENSCEKNYVSEKFFDCVLCNTMPIYYGAPNIEDVYNKESFIPLGDNTKKWLEKLRSITEEGSKPNIESLNKAKDLYFEKYNLYTLLKEILC
jgi:hypothetical protein